jgi:hypothetical protein
VTFGVSFVTFVFASRRVHFGLAKNPMSWHLELSSYERTPELADFANKTLSGQPLPKHWCGCIRASLRSR